MSYVSANSLTPRQFQDADSVHPAQSAVVTVPPEGIQLFEYCDIDHAIAPLPRRFCKDCIEILYFFKGIQIFDMGIRELVINGGNVLIVPSGQEYSTGNHPQYKSSYYRIQLSMTSASLLGLTAEHSAELRSYLASLTDYRYHGSDHLTNLLAASFVHILSDRASVKNQGRGELICFFASLQNQLMDRPPLRTPDIDVAYRYINDHITEEISLTKLAKLSGCSLSYFKERFTSQTGVTPMYYINWRKIAFAKRMIAQDYTVTEVATMLNFTTPAYFSTVFKNYTARTPMQYKRLIDIELKKQQHSITIPKDPR